MVKLNNTKSQYNLFGIKGLTGYENISREIGKSGDTIKSWFQILKDTLVGDFIEPYPLNVAPKETRHPKFYFFDNGIARVAEGISQNRITDDRLGFYLEAQILNELKVYREANRLNFKIYFYNISSIGDIDFVIEMKSKTMSSPSEFITLDIKLAKKWDSKFENMSRMINSKLTTRHKKMIGVYLGDRRLTKNNYQVLPLNIFIQLLWANEIL